MSIKVLALAGAALTGGQAIAQATPQTAPENLAPAPIKVPLATPTLPPVPSGEAPLVIVPVEPSTAPLAPPRARSTPRPAEQEARRRPEPRPMARRSTPDLSAPSGAPHPAPAAVAVPASLPTPTPAPVPSVEPVTVAPPSVAPASEPEVAAGWPGWLLPVALGGIAALVAGLAMLRRRRSAAGVGFVEEVPERAVAPAAPPRAEPRPAPETSEPKAPEPIVTPVFPLGAAPVADPPQFLERPAPTDRAWLDLAAPVVHRAGINFVTATADVELVVRNEGSAPARGIRLAIRLTSAQPGQDAVLDALFAEPVERPATPPFDLGPGEERAVRGIATLSREAIVALDAGGRPMFVPVVALNVLYDAGGGTPGQTTAAFAVGVERADGAKLGPLWLDEPARMHDAIGIRAHGNTVKR